MSYKVDFVNSNYRRWYSNHKDEFDHAVLNCLEEGRLTLREDVWKFEERLAAYVGMKYAVGVGSGTDALFLSLKALGIGPGDEVITVSHTFIATIQAIVHCGATPVLVDVGEDELMDTDLVEAAITEKTKAIIPVQYTGATVDTKRLMYIAASAVRPVYIVDDYCQALGAMQNQQKAGSFGILNAVSFNTAKLLGGLCDGGAVTTDDRELYEKICLLRNHWNVHQLSVDRNDYPQPEEIGWGWKSRLSNVNAAFLNVKFDHIGFILERRARIAQGYNKAFADLPIGLPVEQPGRSWQEYHLRVQDREKFAAFLTENGIETLTRDTTPNHLMNGLGLSHLRMAWFFAEQIRPVQVWMLRISLPVTEALAKTVIRLPLYEWLTDEEVVYIIEKVREFYAK